MTERPILFSGPMVRAILAGEKTATRRVVKPQPEHAPKSLCNIRGASGKRWLGLVAGDPERITHHCPYGAPEEKLWVRETWAANEGSSGGYVYRADYSDGCSGVYQEHLATRDVPLWVARWKPSIHMPRQAARLTLVVTSVRVERLQAITIGDIRREGVACPEHDFHSGFCVGGCSTLAREWVKLWDSINGKREGCSWAANPWVWAIDFQRVSP